MATTAGTPFASIAALARHLAATSKRLEKRRLIAEFLHTLYREEVSPAVLLIVGRIFPEADSKALNDGWATLQKALGATRQARLDARPLRFVTAPVVSLSLVGEPIGSSLLAWLLLAETPTTLVALGGFLALAGIFLTAYSSYSGLAASKD